MSNKRGSAACLPCRNRKSRCRIDFGAATACLTCQSHGTTCVFPPRKQLKGHRKSGAQRSVVQNRIPLETGGEARGSNIEVEGQLLVAPTEQVQRNSLSSVVGTVGTTPFRAAAVEEAPISGDDSQPNGNDSQIGSNDVSILEPPENNEVGHRVIGPLLGSDCHDLSTLLPDNNLQGQRSPPTLRASNRNVWSAPIIFKASRKRPLGIGSELNPAQTKLGLVQKVLEPWLPHLVELFKTKVNTCLPLLDELQLAKLHEYGEDSLSPALVACIFAHSLTFWTCHPVLTTQHRPDHRFIWNLANDTLYAEMRHSPSIYTVVALLLNICGRPSAMIFNNAGQLGFAVALAHTLGLNRDPTSWDMSPHEKRFRIRVWWALVVHDRWSSLAHGIPSHIRATQADVPHLEVDLLLDSENGQVNHIVPWRIYASVVSLTEVLEHYLDFVYCTNKGHADARESQQKLLGLSCKLRSWTDSLEGVPRHIVLRGSNLRESGAANFRFAFLTVQFLRYRFELGACRDGREERHYNTHRAAEDIVVFVQELDESQLRDFWMPMLGFTLLTTMGFLLRSATESTEDRHSIALAQDLLECIRKHRANAAWDLADLCIEQYEHILSSIRDHGFETDNNASQLLPDSNMATTSAIPWDNWDLDDLFSLGANLSWEQ